MSRRAQNISGACGNPLRRDAEHVVFREWRKQGPQMHGLGIELAKSVPEPPAANLTRHVACRFLVEDRPAADGLSIRLSPRPPEEKHRRMLGLGDECFQPTWGNDSEVCVGHTNLSTITCGEM